MQRTINLRRPVPWAIVVTTAILLALGPDSAVAQKSGGKIDRVGDKTAGLIESIVGPILLVVIGVIAFVSLIKRQAGLAFGAIGVGLLAGLFIYAPDSAQAFFDDVYSAVFK